MTIHITFDDLIKRSSMNENELSKIVIGYAIYVHTYLGPGLLESAYKECLFKKLMKNNLWVEKEKPMPLYSTT